MPEFLVVELQTSSLFNNFDPHLCRMPNLPSTFEGVQAYLAGLTFALAASPCNTPVLASILGYVAASRVMPNFNCIVFLTLC
ncbi:hypothetical protein Syun_014044 [Stephania yunnanensis]|uniref:Cytochrome C biogenesis protein transmembrane domain-containing protein n=1 Tax=Stephania yunnanensis TaxID=152371 RepID=A0AAP0JIS9_9MAGN